jgi:GntR family transcriptional regulator/MocR family aminotransferase
LIDQATLAEFIDAGAFYRHIRRCRGEYGVRLQTFVEYAAKLGLPLSFPHTDGGMNLAGFLDDGANDENYSACLHEQGMEVPALSFYSIRPTRVGLLFGFTAFSQNGIRDGMKRAAEALHSVARY